jgi:hypothetical protein
LLRLARQPKKERMWSDIIVDEHEIIKESLR